jgi:hypothetical protein
MSDGETVAHKIETNETSLNIAIGHLARACRKETRLRTEPGSVGYNEIEAIHRKAKLAIEGVPQEHQNALHQLLKAVIGLGEIA